jgi:hypothetical protein
VKDDGDEELVIGVASSKGTQGKTKTDKDIVSPPSTASGYRDRHPKSILTLLAQPTKPRLLYPFWALSLVFVTVRINSWNYSTTRASISSPNS